MTQPLDYQTPDAREDGEPRRHLTFVDLLHIALNVYIAVVGVALILVVILVALVGLFAGKH